MSETPYETIEKYCNSLKINISAGEIAAIKEKLNMSSDELSKSHRTESENHCYNKKQHSWKHNQ